MNPEFVTESLQSPRLKSLYSAGLTMSGRAGIGESADDHRPLVAVIMTKRERKREADRQLDERLYEFTVTCCERVAVEGMGRFIAAFGHVTKDQPRRDAVTAGLQRLGFNASIALVHGLSLYSISRYVRPEPGSSVTLGDVCDGLLNAMEARYAKWMLRRELQGSIHLDCEFDEIIHDHRIA